MISSSAPKDVDSYVDFSSVKILDDTVASEPHQDRSSQCRLVQILATVTFVAALAAATFLLVLSSRHVEVIGSHGDHPIAIVRFSVSSRKAPEQGAVATGTLVHHPATGESEIQVNQTHYTTTIAGGSALLSAPRPESLYGSLDQCVSTSTVPGAEELIRRLRSARGGLVEAVRAAGKLMEKGTGGVSCHGDLIHMQSHGEDALVCVSDSKLLTLDTEHMHVEVTQHEESLDSSPLSSLPCDNPRPAQRRSTVVDLYRAATKAVQPWFEKGDSDVEKLDEEVETKKKKKTCVFIHGVGNTPTAGSESILNGTFEHYWGGVNTVTTQCENWVFLNVDTVQRGWDDKTLQAETCAAATWDPIANTSSMGLIEDRIVFTHSMGNMMLSGAIESGFCHMNNESSTWYEVSGPMLGSKIASKLGQICANETLFKYVAEKMGFCTDGQVTAAYRSLVPGYPGLERLANTLRTRVNGAMCGTSAYGINSMYSVEMEATAALADFFSVNDGVVPWTSCDVEKDGFVEDYTSDWYTASINHIDAECYNGDGWWGQDRKPCSWYALRS